MEDEDPEDKDKDKEDDLPDVPDLDDVDDNIDELDNLDVDSCKQLIADMAIVCAMVSKLCQLSFSIVRSTTIALPAWHRYCKEFGLKLCILPRDIVTLWNSTYYMYFTFKYCAAIDAMTTNEALKLWKFELEDEEWLIVEDLVTILLVTTVVYHPLQH
ncbi:hypothetical protein L208DRAFT_1304505 [Tricholoma matsutake]|nr:hypothetical protein L208DRAFT_1304505 [Tricholoma matsutake 945]